MGLDTKMKSSITFIFQICILINVKGNYIAQEVNEFEKGVIFIHKENFLMTSSHWTLIHDFDFDHFDQQVEFLTQSLESLRTMIVNRERASTEKRKDQARRILPTNGYEILISSFSEYKRGYYNLKGLVTLDKEGRKRRGLIDVGGKALKFLFGTATSKEIEVLNGEITNIKRINKGIIHLVQSQATLLNDTLRISKNNRQKINNLSRRQDSFENLLKIYRYDLAFEIIMRNIEFAMQEFHTQIIELREAIDVLEQGKLSSYFISKEVMYRTLREIQPQLPEGYSLIEQVKADTLFKFYQWITTIAIALPGKLRIFAKMTLKTPSGYFDAYEILGLPTYIPALKAYAYFKTEYPILALSMDRQSYMLLRHHELAVCQISQFAVCSPDVPIFRAPHQSCEYSLYIGNDQKVTELCSKEVIKEFYPIFRRIDKQGTWVFSTPSTLVLVVKCSAKQNNLHSSPSNISKLNNVGIIRLPNTCIGYLPGIILTSHFHMRSTVHTRSSPKFIIPPIETIFSKMELEELQENLITTENPEKNKGNSRKQTDDDIKVAEKSYEQMKKDLDRLLKENEDLFISNTPTIPITYIWIILGSIGILILLICTYYIVKHICWKRRFEKRIKKMSQQDIPLQEIPQRNNAEEEETEIVEPIESSTEQASSSTQTRKHVVRSYRL